MANTKVTGDLLADGTLFARHLNESHGITTSVIGEGTNLFYTDTRVGTYLGTYLPANGYDTATNIIASIVDSAPVTLDTLNELAAALGDDPNFATTVTNSLAGKLPLTGGTLTGALSVNGIITSNSSSAGDYVRLYAGSGSAQWDIYGNGENLRFSENSGGGGSVVIDGNLSIGNTNNTYKLDVSGTGRFSENVTINGTIIGTDQTFGGAYRTFAFGGNSNGFNRIFATTDATDGIYINAATGQGLSVRVNGGGANVFSIASTGAATFTSSTFSVAKFNSTYGQVNIDFQNNGTGFASIGSGVSVTATAAADDLGLGTGGLNKNIVFATGTGYTERMRITSNGFVGIGTVSPIIALSVRKDVNDWIGQFKNYGDSAYGLTVDLSGSTGGQLGYALGVYTQGGTGMFVRNDGRVGIGTTSPAVKLHVDGNALLGDSTPNDFGQRYLQIIGSQGTWGNSSATLYLTQLWNGVAYHAIIEAQQGKVYGNAASDLVFKTSYYSGGVNTVERMRITDNGRVGIGTNSPSNRLSVEGGSIKLNNDNAAANYYLWLNKQNSQDGGILLSRDNVFDWQIVNATTSGDLWAYAYGAGAVAMTIKRSNAYVGIGTTSPSTKLHVAGVTTLTTGIAPFYAARVLNYNGSTTDRQLFFGVVDDSYQILGNAYYYNSSTFRTTATTASFIDFSQGRFRVFTNSGLTADTDYYPTERIRISSEGFITTNPNGDFSGALIANGLEYSIVSVGSQTGYTQGAIVLSSGTDSVPAARGQGTFLFNEGSDITWYIGGLYNSTDRIDICRKTGTTSIDPSTAQGVHSLFNFNSSGAAYNATGTWGSYTSDARLKENIVDASPKLNDILSLKVRNFNYIGKEEKYIGFVAQEFEEVFPSLVSVNDNREFDRDGNVLSGLEDTKGVKVGMDFAILVKAIQEQQAIIESLKSRIETLEQA